MNNKNIVFLSLALIAGTSLVAEVTEQGGGAAASHTSQKSVENKEATTLPDGSKSTKELITKETKSTSSEKTPATDNGADAPKGGAEAAGTEIKESWFSNARSYVNGKATTVHEWCNANPKAAFAIIVGATAVTTLVVVAKSKTVQKFLGIAQEEDEEELFA